MKQRLMLLYDKIMLRKISIIESINDMLKKVAQLVHSRHRSVHNFVMNILAALGAYCFFPTKPEVNFDYEVSESQTGNSSSGNKQLRLKNQANLSDCPISYTFCEVSDFAVLIPNSRYIRLNRTTYMCGDEKKITVESLAFSAFSHFSAFSTLQNAENAERVTMSVNIIQ